MVFKTSYSIRAGNTAAALTANLTLTLKKEKKNINGIFISLSIASSPNCHQDMLDLHKLLITLMWQMGSEV